MQDGSPIKDEAGLGRWWFQLDVEARRAFMRALPADQWDGFCRLMGFLGQADDLDDE